MTDSLLIEQTTTHVRSLTLNRPEKLNAINDGLLQELRAEIARAGADDDVRVLVLGGAGRAFSVGADVGRPKTAGEQGYTAAMSASQDYLRLDDGVVALALDIWRCPIPVIAKVQGYCMGIATIVALCCDLVVCEDEAVFGWPAVPLGGGLISPVWAYYLGAHRAKELSMTVGARVSAQEAVSAGVANRAVPRDRLAAETAETARQVALLSRDLLRIKKAATNQVMNRLGFEDTLRSGAAWDALAHETEIVHETRASIAERGIKAEIATWREAISG